MEALYDRLEFPFLTPRKHRKLTKYAILLNEPKVEDTEQAKDPPCSLATELLPELFEPAKEDMVEIIGDILQSQIKSHDEVDQVPIFKPDDIIENNAPSLIPVMYRIATEHFAQKNKSKFKIIECRNSTKLISDWKPSLPDKLISMGHQVIVVQLETSFVPYSDFAYAILRQLDCDWKNRLPRSFFFPDDVCKVEATPERDLCVVSPSMPDGDLEINKKMGLLNYELLMMIKSSCMSAMKNYLLKRDLRVGKFSDTLDGVSALRQLYRKLQDRLRTGEAVELGSNSLEDLRSLVKQSIGGPDVLAAQTWIEYGKRIGLAIPASASSSATSISSARRIIQEDSDSDGGDEKDDDEEKVKCAVDDDDDESGTYRRNVPISITRTTSSSTSSGLDVDDGRDCQKKDITLSSFNNKAATFTFPADADGTKSSKEVLLHGDGLKRNSKGTREGASNDDEPDENDHVHFTCTTITSGKKNKDGGGGSTTTNSLENEQEEDEGLKLEDFMEFKDSLAKMHKTRKGDARRVVEGAEKDEDEEDYDEFLAHEFSADSILQILQLPNKAL